MIVWEGVIPSIKNPAYIFNKRQDNSIKYADAPYMPQFMDSARSSITNILKKELYKKDQIKSALVIHATYIKYKYKGIGDSTDIKTMIQVITTRIIEATCMYSFQKMI